MERIIIFVKSGMEVIFPYLVDRVCDEVPHEDHGLDDRQEDVGARHDGGVDTVVASGSAKRLELEGNIRRT